MKKLLSVLALTLLLTAAAPASASKSTSHSSSQPTAKKATASKPKSTTVRTQPHSSKCTSCARDTRGRTAPIGTATTSFRRAYPCPSTGKTSGPCKGYVIDHIVPLKRGGINAPENMQWQTTAAAKAKDKLE